MTTPYLRVRNVTKRFGHFTALDDVSIDIHRGEFVCFLGPSGCGKTTLLRAISGLDIQTHGAVEQDGRDISALPPAQRDFGIVFQSYALFQNLTVAANIAYGLENRKRPKAEIQRRVTELLELIGLPESGPKYPGQLSGGQQQRVALARALAVSPWRGRSRSRRGCFCSMSRCRRWTPRCGRTCATRSRFCSASPPS